MPAGIVDPVPPNASDPALLERHRALSRRLRKRRLRLERDAIQMDAPPTRPDLYFDYAPSGRYPIVALRTLPCDLYVKGYCSPCSYSARRYPAGLSGESLYRGIDQQLEWLLSHFDELFVARADGRLAGYRLRRAPDRPWYMFQLAGESSFFRDAEIPPVHRRRILERLCAFQDERGINLHLMLESRPEHLLTAEASGELDALAPLLAALDVVVNVGLEWHDDFLRNLVFAKHLRRDDFVRAMEVATRRRLDPGVFLFTGASILTVSELLEELDRGLRLLASLGLFANVMVPNLQAYTLPDLLYDAGRYNLPEPYFLLDVVDRLLEYRPARSHPVTPFDWFLGGLESDPPPRLTLLDHPRRRTSEGITRAIHACVLELIHTMDAKRYRREASRLRRDVQFGSYRRDLARRDRRPWRTRLSDELEFAQGYLETYDARIRSSAVPSD